MPNLIQKIPLASETGDAVIKVLVVGPVGAGKSAFVCSLAPNGAVETDELASENLGKPKTTVAIDFSVCRSNGRTVHLWGTPGQQRFEFMREIAAEGAHAFLLLISAANPDTLHQAVAIRDAIQKVRKLPYVAVLTHADEGPRIAVDEVARRLGILIGDVEVCCATAKASAQKTIDGLVQRLEGNP